MQSEHHGSRAASFSHGEPESEYEVDYIKLVLKHKRLVIMGVLIGLGLGVLGYIKLGPTYNAKTKLLVSRKASVPLRDQDARTFGERGEHVALIMSPLIVSKAVKEHKLNELPSLRGSSDPVEDIVSSLKVKRSAGRDESFLNVLDISYVNPRPADAEQVVTAIVDAYGKYLSDSRNQNMQEMETLIAEASQKLEKQLEEKQQAYLKFRETAPLHLSQTAGTANGAVATNIHQERVEAIEAEKRQNLLRRAELNSKLKVIEDAIHRGESSESLELLARQFLRVGSTASGATTSPGISGAATTSPDSQLLALILEEQRLLRDFGPEHPDVQRVRRSMEVVREYYRRNGTVKSQPGNTGSGKLAGGSGFKKSVDLVSVYAMSLRQQLSELEHRDRELAGLLHTEEQKAKSMSQFETRDIAFREEINRIQGLWETVVGRLSELQILKDAAGYTMQQISPVRHEVSMKQFIKIFGAGMFIGLAIAGSIAVWREMQNDMISSVDELRRQAGFPVMVGIPSFKSAEAEKQAGDSPLNSSLTYYYRPEAPESEAYRRLRTALFVTIGTEGLQVIQVSSAQPGDGKSTVAANLALSAAQAGKKVLLVDADLRRPSVHQLFGMPSEIGLAEVLAGEIELLNAACETTVSGLSVLTAGSMTTTPAEALASSSFRKLLEVAKQEFDFIFVDSPPVLAVSDACIAAQSTDAMLFVARLNVNTQSTLQKAEELLRINGVRVLGVIANGVAQSADEAADYGNYFQAQESPKRSKEVLPEPAPTS